jgi:hypothetical protein
MNDRDVEAFGNYSGRVRDKVFLLLCAGKSMVGSTMRALTWIYLCHNVVGSLHLRIGGGTC